MAFSGVEPGIRAIDVGCGPGALSVALAAGSELTNERPEAVLVAEARDVSAERRGSDRRDEMELAGQLSNRRFHAELTAALHDAR